MFGHPYLYLMDLAYLKFYRIKKFIEVKDQLIFSTILTYWVSFFSFVVCFKIIISISATLIILIKVISYIKVVWKTDLIFT